MDSEANGTRYEDAEPHGDVQDERRPLGNAGAEYLGHQDVHLATSGKLPVPTLAEPDAPPLHGVEPDEYPRRESLESTTGHQNQKPTLLSPGMVASIESGKPVAFVLPKESGTPCFAT